MIEILFVVLIVALMSTLFYFKGVEDGETSSNTVEEWGLSKFFNEHPMPEGFNPIDGGKELDAIMEGYKDVVPTYYVYDDNGEATGEHK